MILSATKLLFSLDPAPGTITRHCQEEEDVVRPRHTDVTTLLDTPPARNDMTTRYATDAVRPQSYRRKMSVAVPLSSQQRAPTPLFF